MRRFGSVQAIHVNVVAIEEGVVHLAGGQYRAVVEVGSVNFGLAGDTEREAIVASYAAFLNSLTFPVQMLVRALPVDLETYLAEMERQAQQTLTPRLADLARDHAAFVRRLARHRTLLERRFYLVIPAQGEVTERRSRWPLSRGSARLDRDTARRQLTFRCEEVARQLGRCGLTVHRLGDTELAHLYYACWSPELARVQRLRRRLTEYTALVVQGMTTDGRRQ
ncbi:MAG: hypothetical protein KIS91_07300 [Anaerolineae bacterium]|nr:hypothetical protein [Anaerolineae bacterium]